ncbi:hypothetical protein [Streptomyces sp. B6B3]|uniref:hypothetical protein n=1 Tax=Streptomyces sp. B6B3 TaxID=3153570 RepID=UPI00325CE496
MASRPARTWYRPLAWGVLTRWVVGVVVVGTVGAGSVVAVVALRDRSCAEGVTERGGECVGVTDGGYSFDPLLDDVSRRIEEENDRVTGSGEGYVTVAFMVPMNFADQVEREQTLREVQGAYLAQYHANHREDETPRIRLVLANPGPDNAHWEPVARQLVDMADSEHQLRAVTGFNVSIASTRATIEYLTRDHGIPVVAGPLTADDIGNTDERPDAYPGMAKIVPDNGDQAQALGYFNAETVDPTRTLLVEDEREDDNYIASLADVFGDLTAQAQRAPETYESPPDVNDESTLSNTFNQMVNNICSGPADTIYFAGRPVQLRQFVNELGGRHCTTRSFTVITGSGASSLATDKELRWEALSNGVTVQYAAIAHPDAWGSGSAPVGSGGDASAFQELEELVRQAEERPVGPIGAERLDLTDSRAIVIYDAVTTAVRAIWNSVTPDQPIPSLTDIGNAWPRLRDVNRVEGASGWICLDNNGNAYNKAVSVVSLDPEREGGIRFDGVAWPNGEPPTDCSIPNQP